MKRTIELELSQFATVPPTLVDPKTKVAATTLTFKVRGLLHHYFLSKYGESAKARGRYEYEQFLAAGPDWRFQGNGIGADKEAKRNVSNELGKGFARWFHYEHLGFTYFCPFEDLVDRTNVDGSKWTRKKDGDLPDYVCGKSKKDVHLLEAKGRYSSAGFQTKEFDDFREQLQRARLIGATGRPIRVKGFISVARWATEKTPRVRSKLLVEDPFTPGDPPGPDGYSASIGVPMVLGHYAAILEGLVLPLQAEAIRLRQPLAEQTGASRGVWECIAGPLVGRRFVGGVLPDRIAQSWLPLWPFLGDPELRRVWRLVRGHSPFVLTAPLEFFGLEEHVFRWVVDSARRGGSAEAVAGDAVEPVGVPEETGALSLLRDGSVLGPVDFFEPVGVVNL